MKYDLLEVLNTTADVKWTESKGYQHRGKFMVGDDEFTILMDEYTALGKDLVDFGFERNGSHHAVDGKINSSKIIGAIVNASIEKIKKLNPDVVIISVDKKSGLVDSRKSLYSTILKWVSKSSGFLYQSDWVENGKTFVKIAAKTTPSPRDLEEFQRMAKIKVGDEE